MPVSQPSPASVPVHTVGGNADALGEGVRLGSDLDEATVAELPGALLARKVRPRARAPPLHRRRRRSGRPDGRCCRPSAPVDLSEPEFGAASGASTPA
ncbi:hypothetical protein [Streptomyces sulphureus]|uniref:hypothetical protein n=1 Tax=Streptomyces sulphureus TaxID=47758 RepID=UPI001319E227|nr:hypothetical protein [Streptomyces sulphureus]